PARPDEATPITPGMRGDGLRASREGWFFSGEWVRVRAGQCFSGGADILVCPTALFPFFPYFFRSATKLKRGFLRSVAPGRSLEFSSLKVTPLWVVRPAAVRRSCFSFARSE